MPTSKTTCVLAVALAFLTGITPASAMSFETGPYPGNPGTTVAFAKGAIEAGDAERFIDLLERNSLSDRILVVTSPGGSVDAALALADEIEAQCRPRARFANWFQRCNT